MQRSWNPYILLVVLKMMQPLWKTVRQFCKMLNLELPRDAAIPLLGINTQKNGKFMSTQKPVCECTQQPKIVNNPMCNN